MDEKVKRLIQPLYLFDSFLDTVLYKLKRQGYNSFENKVKQSLTEGNIK